jgi:hypothetical protein
MTPVYRPYLTDLDIVRERWQDAIASGDTFTL